MPKCRWARYIPKALRIAWRECCPLVSLSPDSREHREHSTTSRVHRTVSPIPNDRVSGKVLSECRCEGRKAGDEATSNPTFRHIASLPLSLA